MRTFLSLILTFGLVGCKAQLNEEDSQAAFWALNVVSRDVQAQAYATFEEAAKEIVIDDDGDTYTFAGDVEGDGSAGWSGVVQVDGFATYTAPDYAFDFALDYVGAECSGLVLDGGLDLEMAYGYESGEGTYRYQYTMYGAMDATGEAEGTIDFDYTLTIAVDTYTETVEFDAAGDINGYDVSGWTTEGSGSFNYGDYESYYTYNE